MDLVRGARQDSDQIALDFSADFDMEAGALMQVCTQAVAHLDAAMAQLTVRYPI